MSKSAINVHAAKTQFSNLFERAEAGEVFVIARGGKPVARLGPLKGARRAARKPGLLAGRVRIAADFDAHFPEDVLASFADAPIEPRRKAP